jgi:nucleoid-associated protein YgaU
MATKNKHAVYVLAGAGLLSVLLAFAPSAVTSLRHSTVVTTTVTVPASTVTVTVPVTPAPDVPADVPVPADIPPAPVPAVKTYTVQDGDTLSGIAFDFYGHSDRAADIAAANSISDVDSISVGQVLVIP